MEPWKRCEELYEDGSVQTGSGPFTLGDCDAAEIAAAAACGVLGGLVDVFLVGAPGDKAPLETWADAQVDDAVQKFARFVGWNPSESAQDVAHAIGFLEHAFEVNYDQRYGADLGGLFDMSARDHHIKSLAHAPDLIGLFFSILNQFTSTAAFAASGALITVRTDLFDPTCNATGKAAVELLGKTPAAKLFCGFSNWLGHVMSDVAGSSVTRRHSGDGSGLAAPFLELFQFCKVGSFDLGDRQGDLAELAVRVFQQGYDARFALSLGAPVLMTELAIRLIYAVEQRFRYERPLSECLATKTNDGLRAMLLIGMGTLCAIDGTDAAVRSKGKNAVTLAMRLNYLAWLRLAMLVIKELGIRLSLERDVEAMRELNSAYESYLKQLEDIDVAAFKQEAAAYEGFAGQLRQASTEEDIERVLEDAYDAYGIKRPWQGDFDSHMADRDATLRFA